MKYLVIKFWIDNKGNKFSSRAKIGTEEECDKFIKQEKERLKNHKGCTFEFIKKEESMEKRFLIDGAVYKLEGDFFNMKEAIRVLKIASTVIQNASNNISEQGFSPSARIPLDQTINIYNSALRENGFEAVRLVRVDKKDDIIIEL